MAEGQLDVDSAWSDDGVPLKAAWPIWVAFGCGAVGGLVWLAVGRPDVPAGRWLMIAGVLIAAIASITGPSARRSARFVLWACISFVVPASLSIVATLGKVALDGPSSGDVSALAVSCLVLAFFGGGGLLVARSHRPERRVAPAILRQVPPPAATRRRPKTVQVRCVDGEARTVTLMEGGYLALRSGTTAAEIVDVLPD